MLNRLVCLVAGHRGDIYGFVVAEARREAPADASLMEFTVWSSGGRLGKRVRIGACERCGAVYVREVKTVERPAEEKAP